MSKIPINKHRCTDCHKCLNCGKRTFTPTNPSRPKKFCGNTCQLKYHYSRGEGPKKLPKWVTKEFLETLYVKERKSVLQIAKKTGKSLRQVSRYLHRFDIPTRPFSMEGIRDERHPCWQGGKTEIGRRFRHRIEYKKWRKAVFERDNWTCRACGKRGGNLQADHIKPFAQYPDLRLKLDNGRTLCIPCHRKTDTFGNGAKKQQGRN